MFQPVKLAPPEISSLTNLEYIGKDTAFSIDDIALIPRKGIITSRSQVEIHPFIYSAPMDTVTGYDLTEAMLDNGHNAIVSRFINKEEYIATIKDFAMSEHSNRFFVAIGLDANYEEFINQLRPLFENPNWTINVAIDIAHGDSKDCYKAIHKLRASKHIDQIMSGSICTPDAAHRNILAGVTHLRVGVGPGSACTTRRMTGFGIPNAYAIHLIHQSLLDKGYRHRVIIIADGGIKEPGDACKYLALGADAIMLGNVLAKTRESAGWELRADGSLIKAYRGQASREFQSEVLHKKYDCPEGVSLPPKLWDGTTTQEVINWFEGGLRSAVSYAGLSSSNSMSYSDVDFVFITPSGITEGTPHGLTRG